MNLAIIREHLELVDGVLVWRTSNKRRKAGESAGGVVGKQGYRMVQVQGRRYLVHRAVWALHTGRVPTGLVDHKDRDTSNDHPDNLREGSGGENNANSTMSSRNTSGVKGLTFDRTNNCWQGTVQLGNTRRRKRSVDKQAVIDWIKHTRAEVHGEYAFTG